MWVTQICACESVQVHITSLIQVILSSFPYEATLNKPFSWPNTISLVFVSSFPVTVVDGPVCNPGVGRQGHHELRVNLGDKSQKEFSKVLGHCLTYMLCMFRRRLLRTETIENADL